MQSVRSTYASLIAVRSYRTANDNSRAHFCHAAKQNDAGNLLARFPFADRTMNDRPDLALSARPYKDERGPCCWSLRQTFGSGIDSVDSQFGAASDRFLCGYGAKRLIQFIAYRADKQKTLNGDLCANNATFLICYHAGWLICSATVAPRGTRVLQPGQGTPPTSRHAKKQASIAAHQIDEQFCIIFKTTYECFCHHCLTAGKRGYRRAF
jgi:hypothetical protein